jgi:hypothetical protein
MAGVDLSERPQTDSGRRETELERIDRNLSELLQELRVAQTGVQILFAFLLTLPFSQRFGQLTSYQRGIYLVTLIFAAAASGFLIAPVSYHRLIFRRRDKRHLVFTANRLAIAGLVCLALAMIGAIYLVVDFLYKGGLVAAVVGGIAGLFAILWYIVPLVRRMRHPVADR